MHEFGDLKDKVDSLCIDADDFLNYYKAEVSAEKKIESKPPDTFEKKAENLMTELEAFRLRLVDSFEQKASKLSPNFVKPEKKLQHRIQKFINCSEFVQPELENRCFRMNCDSTKLLFKASLSSGITKIYMADFASLKLEYECVLEFDC